MSEVVVFKFGGASVKDADGVKNLLRVVKLYGNKQLCIVLSAMGKTTNALEDICNTFYNRANGLDQKVQDLIEFHFGIINNLFPNGNKPLENDVESIFAELYWAIEEEQIKSYDFEYDQIISLGELLSTRIVSAYLNSEGYPIQFLDARDLIRTDNNYREGRVDWEVTSSQINSIIKLGNDDGKVPVNYITQGFIGGTSENFTTTLGREGSDYTASILAFCLNAQEVIIWKDVDGVLNADPRKWKSPELISDLSYFDAIELTYFGATIIHPKTIKPLQNKLIPLRVKSFLNPENEGTIITENHNQKRVTSYIFKENQYLLSISTRDFSFIVEENIEEIFKAFNKSRVKVNLMQQAALTFSVCLTAEEKRWSDLMNILSKSYKLKYNKGCELITIRHYNEPIPKEILSRGEILLEQRSRHTLQYVIKK